MKDFGTLLFLSLALMAFSCRDGSDPVNLTQDERDLGGSWLMYQRGYSPGAGYIVEEIPREPAQLIHFYPDHTFASNIQGLWDYTHYRVIEDTTMQSKIVALFKSDPVKFDPAQLEHSYQAELVNGNLKLSFRFCIEGCHMAFQPAKLDEK